MPVAPRSPRRWLRFGMRGLLAFVTLSAVAARFGSHVNDYHAEQRALAELRGLGGSFIEVGGLPIFL